MRYFVDISKRQNPRTLASIMLSGALSLAVLTNLHGFSNPPVQALGIACATVGLVVSALLFVVSIASR